MPYPSSGALTNIPKTEVKISDFKKKSKADQELLLNDPTDYLWVLDVEPGVNFPYNAPPDLKKEEDHHELNRMKITHPPIPGTARIFPNRPDIKDIEQAYIGDCWFLAAITAVLALPGGPEYIESMMQDDQKDWVTLRLYDRRARDAKSKKLEFRERFVKMKRTLVSTGTKKTIHSSAEGGMWVCMLEKALSAFNKINLQESNEKNPGYYACFQPHDATYLNLVGGSSRKALGLFFGIEFDRKTIPSEIDNLQEYSYLKVLLASAGIPKTANPGQLIANPPQSNPKIPNRPILDSSGFDSFHREAYKDVGDLYDHFEAAHTNHYLMKGGKEIKVKGSLRLEDFVHFIIYESGINDVTVKEGVISWVAERGIFPGKRGTGKYSTRQKGLFSDIRGYLAAGPVCIGTEEYVGRTSSGRGHSGGESKTKGLVGGHAYAVLNTIMADNESYLLVSNPWGRYGRIYKQIVERRSRVSPDEDDQGCFWLDLFDLTKRADVICYASGNSSTDLFKKLKSASSIDKSGLETYPSVDKLPGSGPGSPFAEHPEYSYQINNTFLCKRNLSLLKDVLAKIDTESKKKTMSSKNAFERNIKPQDMKAYMVEVLGLVAELNDGIHAGRMQRVKDNKKDKDKKRDEKNYFLIQDSDLVMVRPSTRNPLQLKEWQEASALSILAIFATRKRIVPVDEAVNEYINQAAKTETDVRKKLAALLDSLGVILERTRFYLNNYTDSGRRMGTGALEYLVILEIVRLLELLYLMKIDYLLVSPDKNQGRGITYLKSQAPNLVDRKSIPKIIESLYKKKP
jgi:hypothetical protein